MWTKTTGEQLHILTIFISGEEPQAIVSKNNLTFRLQGTVPAETSKEKREFWDQRREREVVVLIFCWYIGLLFIHSEEVHDVI